MINVINLSTESPRKNIWPISGNHYCWY